MVTKSITFSGPFPRVLSKIPCSTFRWYCVGLITSRKESVRFRRGIFTYISWVAILIHLHWVRKKIYVIMMEERMHRKETEPTDGMIDIWRLLSVFPSLMAMFTSCKVTRLNNKFHTVEDAWGRLPTGLVTLIVVKSGRAVFSCDVRVNLRIRRRTGLV